MEKNKHKGKFAALKKQTSAIKNITYKQISNKGLGPKEKKFIFPITKVILPLIFNFCVKNYFKNSTF